MALSCGARCAKGVLITFNLVFWLSGCAIIAFGIFMLIEEEKATLFRLFQVDDQYAHLQYLAYALIAIGGLVFIVGFFGCCGAIQENKCLLGTYFVFLFLILAAELAVGILSVVFQDKAVMELEGKLKETLRTKYGRDLPLTHAFDLAQAKFNCCGIKDYSDYEDSAWKRDNIHTRANVTKTCCVLINAQQSDAYLNPQPVNESLCQSSTLYPHYRHQIGCQTKLEEFIKEKSTLFLAIGCGIAALEIFGMIISICSCKAF